MVDAPEPNASSESVSPSTLFKAFFILGCTAIGGSLAHLSAFRESLVVRRRWITNHSFADVVTLAQTLPGPTSTQVALGIGLLRGGFLGGIASILGFILPGAAFLTFVGLFVTWNESIVRSNWSAGLRAFACAVVALAVWGMIRRLTHGNVKGFLCAAAFLICAGWNDPLAGIACIAFSLILGGVACPNRVEDASSQHTRLKPVHFALSIGALLIVVIAISGAWLPMSRNNGALVQLIAALAQSGSLVFGGDHVILPLLEHSVVLTGLIPADSFLTGYSIAQVVPGPIFNVAAFAGVSLTGWTGACAATLPSRTRAHGCRFPNLE